MNARLLPIALFVLASPLAVPAHATGDGTVDKDKVTTLDQGDLVVKRKRIATDPTPSPTPTSDASGN